MLRVVAGLPLAHAGHVLAYVFDVVAYVVNAGIQYRSQGVQCAAGGRPLRLHSAASTALECQERGDSRNHGRAND
ncbi:hypothetical protein [Streptomyces sp. NPDC058272]|uniref:hypothetical protein n=1 Tax=Streptomyces sp. NPDC058272 TaxID=3346415 RepID=UPI0036E95761